MTVSFVITMIVTFMTIVAFISTDLMTVIIITRPSWNPIWLWRHTSDRFELFRHVVVYSRSRSCCTSQGICQCENEEQRQEEQTADESQSIERLVIF